MANIGQAFHFWAGLHLRAYQPRQIHGSNGRHSFRNLHRNKSPNVRLPSPPIVGEQKEYANGFRTGVISFFRASWNIHQAYDYVSTGRTNPSVDDVRVFNFAAYVEIAPDITLHSFANVIP